MYTAAAMIAGRGDDGPSRLVKQFVHSLIQKRRSVMRPIVASKAHVYDRWSAQFLRFSENIFGSVNYIRILKGGFHGNDVSFRRHTGKFVSIAAVSCDSAGGMRAVARSVHLLALAEVYVIFCPFCAVSVYGIQRRRLDCLIPDIQYS